MDKAPSSLIFCGDGKTSGKHVAPNACGGGSGL